jgi:hypothetical protein
MQLSLFLLSAAALVSAATATDRVNLGAADFYVILAQTGITAPAVTTDTVAITGSIGVSPIAHTAITNLNDDLERNDYETSSEVTGVVHAADYGGAIESQLTTAVGLGQAAYDDAASRPTTSDATLNLGGGDISGMALAAGVYTFGTDIQISSGTLSLTGSASDIYILKTTGNLVQAAGTAVDLGNVKPENVFWQVAGYAKVGTGSTMQGILLVKTKVDFLENAILNGRVFAQTACNLLKGATITQPDAVPTGERRSLRGNN